MLNNTSTITSNLTVVSVEGPGSRLSFGNAAALSTGTLRMNSATGSLDNTSGGSLALTGLSGFQIQTSFTFNGTNSLDLSGAASTSFIGTAGATRTVTVTSKTLTIGGILTTGTDVAGTTRVNGALTKDGTGTLVLTSASDYTGATTVTAGTLVINGDNSAATGTVDVQSGAALAGNGRIGGALGGAGSINPGNSPGILTGTTVDFAGGLDFNFELTATGNPTWNNASSSVNDVLHLTDTVSPFSSIADSNNNFNIFLGVASITSGDAFNGGFFAGTADFASSVNAATYNYLVLGDGGGGIAYNGNNYYTLAQYNTNHGTSWTIDHGTFAVTGADFATGTVDGFVQQFNVVPEPTAWLLAAFGLTTAVVFRRRRQD